MTLSNLTTGGWIYFAVWMAIVPAMLIPTLDENGRSWKATSGGVGICGLMTAYLLWLVTT